jgi:hypothetical protein
LFLNCSSSTTVCRLSAGATIAVAVPVNVVRVTKVVKVQKVVRRAPVVSPAR